MVESAKPTQLSGWLQVASIVILIPIGGFLASLTGYALLSPLGAIGLPLIAATMYLRFEGVTWRSLIFGDQRPWHELAVYSAVALIGTVVTVFLTVTFLQKVLGFPVVDISVIQNMIEGNFLVYLWFLIAVSWGSAGIGEELLVRGFLLHRMEGLSNLNIAVVLQAVIFAFAHFYQGITGIISIFAMSLVFAAVYVKSGRNLLTVIVAHGLIDTFSMTALYFGRGDLIIGS